MCKASCWQQVELTARVEWLHQQDKQNERTDPPFSKSFKPLSEKLALNFIAYHRHSQLRYDLAARSRSVRMYCYADGLLFSGCRARLEVKRQRRGAGQQSYAGCLYGSVGNPSS